MPTAEPQAATPPHGVSRWFALVWVLYTGCVTALTLTSFPALLRYLIPGPPDHAFLVLVLGCAAFLAFVAPLWWHPTSTRLARLGHGVMLALLAVAPLLFLGPMASRLYPLATAGAIRAALVLAAFSLFCFMLHQYTPRWYFLVQGMLTVGAPLMAFLLTEMVAVRQASFSLLPLEAGSVGHALHSALQSTTSGSALPLWSVSAILFVLAAAVLAVLPNAADSE